jgi:hypothetical protein
MGNGQWGMGNGEWGIGNGFSEKISLMRKSRRLKPLLVKRCPPDGDSEIQEYSSLSLLSKLNIQNYFPLPLAPGFL